MKIKISYEPEEKKEAAASVTAFLQLHPGAKVRKSDRHAPIYHTYITTTKPKNHCSSKENT